MSCSPCSKKKKKINKATYVKMWKEGLDTVSNIVSRVVLSRKKIVWDILEEIKMSKVDMATRRKSENLEDQLYDHEAKCSRDNSKTEPSTELEQQAFDKTDLDYYFLERLEKMRDCGIKDEEYDLIEQEEKFSLERADQSFDDNGYHSDNENTNSHSSEQIFANINKGPKDLGNGILANYEEEEQVFYCKNGDIIETMRKNPNSVKSCDEMGNSSVLTMELKYLLKEWNEYSKASEVSSDIDLSNWITGTSTINQFL